MCSGLNLPLTIFALDLHQFEGSSEKMTKKKTTHYILDIPTTAHVTKVNTFEYLQTHTHINICSNCILGIYISQKSSIH